MELPLLICISIIVGLIIGTLSGMLGIGGGTMMVPVFKVLFHMSAIQSTATSLFTIIPTSISGAITHIRNKTCLPLVGLSLGIGGAITSPIGVYLASISPEWGTMVAAAIVLFYSAFTMFSKAIKLTRANKQEAVIERAEEATMEEDLSAFRKGFLTRRTVLMCIAIGLVAGIVSGYVGVGGGFLMVPMMLSLLHLPMKLTSGTSLIAVMILAIPGTITQAVYGNIVWVAGVFIAIGAIPGAFIGSKLIKRIPEVALRYVFACLLIVAGGVLVSEQIGLI